MMMQIGTLKKMVNPATQQVTGVVVHQGEILGDIQQEAETLRRFE